MDSGFGGSGSAPPPPRRLRVQGFKWKKEHDSRLGFRIFRGSGFRIVRGLGFRIVRWFRG